MWRSWGSALALVVYFLAQGATWTVCPEGCDFTLIQEALDAAKPGDTLEVGPGQYAGDLWVKRAVTLVGAGRDQVRIQGNVFVWACAQVAISGLTVEGKVSVEDSTGIVIANCAAQGVLARSSSLTLRSCEIAESPTHGILATLSSRLLVFDSVIRNCSGDGINVAASFLDVRSVVIRNNQGWAIWGDPFSTVAGDVSPGHLDQNALGALGGRAVYLDRVPPEAPASVRVEPSDWTSGPITVTWTASPDLSGIAAVWYKIGTAPTGPEDGTRVWGASRLVLPAPPEGRQTVFLWLEDRAGNKSERNRGEVAIQADRTPPAVQISAPAQVAETSFSVTLAVEDRAGEGSGSGVASLRYSNDGKTWTSWEGFKTSLTWDLTKAGGDAKPGDRTLYLQVRDRAGNVKEVRATVRLAQVFAWEEGILSLAMSQTGLLAMGLSTGHVRVFNPTSGIVVLVLRGHTAGVYGVVFSPTADLLATGGLDNTVRIWDGRTGAELRVLRGHTGGVWTVAFSPDGKWLASGSSDGTVRLWNPTNGKLIRTLEGRGGAVRVLGFSPDGKVLATGSDDRAVRLWDPQRGTLVRTLTGHSDWVRALCFSPDGKVLASGCCGKFDRGICATMEIKVWDVASGRELRTWQAPGEGVRSLTFSLDGRTLVGGAGDGRVVLWTWEDQKAVGTFAGHTLPVTGTTFNDNHLLSVGEDGKLIIWQAGS